MKWPGESAVTDSLFISVWVLMVAKKFVAAETENRRKTDSATRHKT